MGIYMIGVEEFINGHYNATIKEGENYTFEDFLRDYESEVSAVVVAKAWNTLANKYGWKDKLRVR